MLQNLRKCFRKYKTDENGTTAVEFGLVAIPFLLMIFGVMEAGRMAWTMNGIQYAVEETTRYASLNSDLTTENFQDYAEDKLSEMLMSSDSLQITFSTLTSNGIDFVEIDADYTHTTMLSGFLPYGFGNIEFDRSVRKPLIN